MRLDEQAARARLAGHDHGVLCTLHAERGVDAVPVVYAVVGDRLGIPIDTVKAKSSVRLQRVRNLEADNRATLLIEAWDRDDWSRLWWVRTELRWVSDPAEPEQTDLATALRDRYPQYSDSPFADVLVFEIVGSSGWAASESASG